MIMIQQQVYQHFSPSSVVKRDGASPSPPTVIKETESIRNLSISHHDRSRSASPVERPTLIKRSASPAAATKVIMSPARGLEFGGRRIIKRSISADYDDDEPLDGDVEDHIISQAEKDSNDQYDSDPEGRDYDRLQDYSSNGQATTDDEDLPLDLSLSTERRRARTYSDSESDDSAATGEEKAGGKAAYKKSLMKRYRKLTNASLFLQNCFSPRFATPNAVCLACLFFFLRSIQCS